MSIHSFSVTLSNGEPLGLEAFRGKTTLIVNTASQCGFTPQYEVLEQLYRTYQEQGFAVLAFPCNQFGEQEPGTDEEIRTFCQTKYDVTFPIFQKVEVNGELAHPLYQYLREQAPEDSGMDENNPLYRYLSESQPELLQGSNIRWNFTKFLVDGEGNVVKRYAPTASMEEIEDDVRNVIEQLSL